MYDYLDRLAVSLNASDAFLLTVLRDGASAMAGRRCLGHALRPHFAAYGIAPALPHAMMALAIVARHSAETIVIATPASRRVTEHEAILLALFSADAGLTERHMRTILAMLLDDDALVEPAYRAIRATSAFVGAADFGPAGAWS